MSREGELNYLRDIGPERARHAIDKPFSDAACGSLLADFGSFASLLPAPPGRLLDVGCGTGWTSVFLARMGYDVTGIDLAPDMIAAANANKERYGTPNVTFAVSDFEKLTYRESFDCVASYQSLHHAENDEAVIRGVFAALRPGGVFVTAEPGRGHARSPISQEAVRTHDVTERDMPPSRIIRLARQAGFSSGRIYPVPPDIRRDAARHLKWALGSLLFRRGGGYVVLVKP
ncbi:MAG TPA: methyltransferase domain-containing protein [Candidatus Baltobacteraceae bacterium]|nr:methyltransferase domain-containing protein [Candidatus Baltobacteraceae bacterium]